MHSKKGSTDFPEVCHWKGRRYILAIDSDGTFFGVYKGKKFAKHSKSAWTVVHKMYDLVDASLNDEISKAK